MLRICTYPLKGMQILVATSVSAWVHLHTCKPGIKPYDPNPVQLTPVQAHAKWRRLQILYIRLNIATAVHTRRHVKVVSFINVSSALNSVPRQNATQALCRFNFLASTPDAARTRSRHPLHSTGTVRRAHMDQTLSPHTPSSPWTVHRKHLERTTAPLEARPSYCIQARNACACSLFS